MEPSSADEEVSKLNLDNSEKSKLPEDNLEWHVEKTHHTYLNLAVIILICFNVPFGTLGILLSMRSAQCFTKLKDDKLGEWWANLSLSMSMAGIVTTVVSIIVVVHFRA